jgi:hypothetical protein
LLIESVSVAVNLDFFLETDALLDQEFVDVTSVVTLKLDYGAPLRVFVSGAVATPGLLEKLEDFL